MIFRRKRYQGKHERHDRPHRRPRPFRKLKLIILILILAVAALYLALLLNRDWGRQSTMSVLPAVRTAADYFLRLIA